MVAKFGQGSVLGQERAEWLTLEELIQKVERGLWAELRNHMAGSMKGDKCQALFVVHYFSTELCSHVLDHKVRSKEGRLGGQNVQGRSRLIVKPRAVPTTIQFVQKNLLDG